MLVVGSIFVAPLVVALSTGGVARTPSALRAPRPIAGLFDFMKPQSSPADLYDPDMTSELPSLPANYDRMYDDSAAGVRAAIDDGLAAVEIDVRRHTDPTTARCGLCVACCVRVGAVGRKRPLARGTIAMQHAARRVRLLDVSAQR
jgi:hypothetical protein